jgi:hypothetical protein
VLRILDRSGFIKKLGREWIFVRVHDAVLYCKSHTRIALSNGAASDDAAPPADGSAKRRGAVDAAAAAAVGVTKARE